MTRHACVVGSGAREHALALALSRTADVSVAPGSAAMRGSRITPTGTIVLEVDADLYVVGPEQPLVDGLADELRARGKLVVGPGRDGARLEGSKSFMKGVLTAAGVPTARYGTFERVDEAVAFLRELGGTVVVKTDGLAAGKGVLVTDDLDAAAADVAAKLSGAAFGDAGRRVVVEEGLAGTECSLLVLVDGHVRRAARAGARLQATRRRRPWAEHGRHGRGLAVRRRRRRARGCGHGRRRRADA